MCRLLEQSGRIHSSRKSLVTRVRRTSARKLFPVKEVSRKYQQQVLKHTRCGAARYIWQHARFVPEHQS